MPTLRCFPEAALPTQIRIPMQPMHLLQPLQLLRCSPEEAAHFQNQHLMMGSSLLELPQLQKRSTLQSQCSREEASQIRTRTPPWVRRVMQLSPCRQAAIAGGLS